MVEVFVSEDVALGMVPHSHRVQAVNERIFWTSRTTLTPSIETETLPGRLACNPQGCGDTRPWNSANSKLPDTRPQVGFNVGGRGSYPRDLIKKFVLGIFLTVAQRRSIRPPPVLQYCHAFRDALIADVRTKAADQLFDLT